MKKAKAKAKPKRDFKKVHKVKLGKDSVVRIVADKGLLPAVVHTAPSEVEVVPVAPDKSWWDMFDFILPRSKK